MVLEERDEERTGKPDDVEVVTLDPLDEAAAEALDRVGAGTPLPLPARRVCGDGVVREQRGR